MNELKNILKEVGDYYTDKIIQHGVTAKGVDWNSEESQYLRFDQLVKALPCQDEFSLLDYGCGYGALLDYLKSRFSNFSYVGFDISNEMLAKASEANGVSQTVKWISSLGDETSDYAIASGIFNVKLNQELSVWTEYVEATLMDINNRTTHGFSFNMLTSYSDREFMKDYLYYADPGYYFNFCKKNFSKYVALLHDYPLYEFSIIVKKQL